MSKMTSISFDEKTSDLLICLKVHYCLSSKAEVIRKAVALLSIAMQAEKEGAKLIIKGKDWQKEIVLI